jgi:hypothetical protein
MQATLTLIHFPERIPQLKKGEILKHIYRYESCSHITNPEKTSTEGALA